VVKRSAKRFRERETRVLNLETQTSIPEISLQENTGTGQGRLLPHPSHILPLDVMKPVYFTYNKKHCYRNYFGLSKKLRLTFISSSGDSFFMSSTREDWSELAVAVGGVGLVPMTTRIRLYCSPPHNNDYCQPQEPQEYHWLLLGQPLLWLIITLTHIRFPGQNTTTKMCSDPTYIKRELSTRLFYFNLNMTNSQQLLWRDNDCILLLLCYYVTAAAPQTSKSLRFQHATVFEIEQTAECWGN